MRQHRHTFYLIILDQVMLRTALTDEFEGMHSDIFEGLDEVDKIDMLTSTTAEMVY